MKNLNSVIKKKHLDLRKIKFVNGGFFPFDFLSKNKDPEPTWSEYFYKKAHSWESWLGGGISRFFAPYRSNQIK